jgi:DNA-binding response OmpR family regulator
MTRKIVVIDDEQDILEIIKAVLKTKGYYVYPADNGDDGWRLIQENHPDLIISDLKMPKVSGLELTKRLHASEEFRNIPLIIMSGIGHESGKPDEFWREGLKVDEFISKPFDPLDLLGRVEYIFRRKEYKSEAGGVKTSPPAQQQTQAPPTILPSPVAQNSSGVRINSSPATTHKQPAAPVRKEKPPEDVVRDFVEAWNTQNFPLEYHCITEEMTGGISEQDYVRRRFQCYQENMGKYQTQTVVSVEESKITRQMATVVIIREDKKGGRITRSRQTYVLRKLEHSWGIVSVKTQSI